MTRYYVKIIEPNRKSWQFAYPDNRWQARSIAKTARKQGKIAEVYKLLRI